MKKLSALFPVLLFVCFAFFQSCQSTKSATTAKMLRFNLEKGKGYDYEMTTSMDMEVMGQKVNNDMNVYYSMTVDDDTSGLKSITATYERVKMNMGVMGFTINVDTDKPVVKEDTTEIGKGLGMITKLFSSMKGRQIHMKVDAEGKVKEITGVKEMATGILDSMGDELPENAKDEMQKTFDKQFNENDIRSQFERVLYIFPNKEVKVGDSWEKNTNVSGQVPAKYNSTYTVKEIEGDMVTLNEKSIVEANDDKAKVTGKVTGTIIVDSRNGLVVNSDQEMNMNVKSPEGMSMEIHGLVKVKGKAL